MSIYDDAMKTLEAQKKRMSEDAYVRLWDGNWSGCITINDFFDLSMKFVRNDSGDLSIQLPLDSEAAELLMDPERWPTKSMYITVDKDGARWSGRVVNSKTDVTFQGERYFELTAVHDYQKAKELLVWSNPFLPAEVQFPKAWMLYGPARWAVASTLFVNLLRKNNSLWMIPDDPLDVGQWFDLDMSNWNMVVKPVKFFDDTSMHTFVSSRFKYFHDCVESIMADAQLTLQCRRYLKGEDEPPIPGKDLRNGCLVWEVVDNAGYNKQTAFGGNFFTGFDRRIRRIMSDGLTEKLDYVETTEQPEEYFKQGFIGTVPTAPWVVLQHGEMTGVNALTYEYSPPGPSQFVTGGSSMMGVNEAIKASVITVGGIIGSIIGQSQIGAAADALLEPLYSDVFLAFKANKHHSRIREQGWDYPFEKWVDGADKAYSVAGWIAMRKALEESREKFSVTVEMENGSPYFVGPAGYGDFFLGDRVGVHALGMPEGRLMVEQVQELEYTRNSETNGWRISVGKPEFDSGINFLVNRFQKNTEALKELGVW